MPDNESALYKIIKGSCKAFIKRWLRRYRIHFAPSTEVMRTEARDREMPMFRTPEDFRSFQVGMVSEGPSPERLIAEKNRANRYWSVWGFCECCRKPGRFLVDWRWSDGITPNFKEGFVCEHCGLNSRQRFTAGYLVKRMRDGRSRISDLYVYEQLSPLYAFIRRHAGEVTVIGSEYLGPRKKPGRVTASIRHEDALDLSLDNNSIDIMVANDIFEHVPDIRKALREACRVLRQNGSLIFTIPFNCSQTDTVQRAMMDEGRISHILPPQFHGNPLSADGSPVFYDFGWDILAMLKEAGFRDAYVVAYYSLYYVYLGFGSQFLFVAEK